MASTWHSRQHEEREPYKPNKTGVNLCQSHFDMHPMKCCQLQAVQERTAGFRPSKLKMEAALQSIAVVLCNDKPQTFGAPDVLQLSTHHVLVHWSQDTQLPDRPPNQVLSAKPF